MATVVEGVRLSPMAYLQHEEAASIKSEYWAGALFPMAGGSANHNRIAVGVCSALDLALEVGRCEVFNGRWLLTEYTSDADVITLESINVEIPVRQLCRRMGWSLG